MAARQPARKKLAPAVRETARAHDYPALLAEVKARIQAAQYAALRAVNKTLVRLYWDVGQLIVERQHSEGWGKGVVEQLSNDLRAAFPGVGGFSVQNLWYMRQFYQEYSAAPKLQPLVGEIGWAHNLLIMSRCKDAHEREFYLRMTRKFGWSKNVLAHQIDNQSYEKSLLGQTNFDKALTPALRAQAKLAVKDEYTFDFLELGDKHSERELERALMTRIEDFLRAMGGMFAFLGSQYRLEVEGDEYFIDLLLFHRRLRSLVAIELKIGKFEPEFVGKMQFYLAALDAQVRQDDENPSIGIILCKEKKRTIVEYALRDARKPIGVATYAITKSLPKALQGQLPSPEAIARLLETL
ncbi:PDDEXK nuclease domain-containing protein [Ralstonia solanacearum]|uniref:PDDEXK nuclease domain-containing protein n=1 Tax=Ralstonia solanacearum TaxID=305 RepID=UPI001FF7DD04|nr:PDDEXK nuclease domain-containing protein [Ralstonia solanacearum]MDB0527506.1 PDDEXK nuclease domain-containing protein [Ralstonia solanacearum]